MNRTGNRIWDLMTMGVCYYPEHWPKDTWRSDLERMKDAGVDCVRIAEFAWNITEPEEGVFCFDFFREFLDLCAQIGVRVIFCTPTATPPAWLSEKYPEVLNCRIDGTPYRHGCRRHYTHNAPVYRRLCARIVRKLAENFATHPAIIGWQIDNEFNCETDVFYSEADSVAFRAYLKRKFQSLDRLNAALGAVFWNQTYSGWEQLYVPRLTVKNNVNPHLQLEFYRFISQSVVEFCDMQADILRQYVKPGDFIVTNGMFSNIDNHRLTRECLDVYAYDSYPNFAYGLSSYGESVLDDRKWSHNLSMVRSICPHFAVMEQQSGANGWNTGMLAPAPRPGQLELWAMQSVAHGADYISFFRWRTCCFGTEIYWHGILDYDGRDNRKLAELKTFRRHLRALDSLCAAEFCTPFALVRDYDNEWDAQLDACHNSVDKASAAGLFEASQLHHTPYNIVCLGQPNAGEQLAKHAVAIYPHPVMMDAPRVDVLREFVKNGGTLIIGCRAGYKDMEGHCVTLVQPGLLSDLTGTQVCEFTFCSPAEESIRVQCGGESVSAPLFNDVLTPLGNARILAEYENGFYRGGAALVENRIGKGRILHWGSVFTCEVASLLFSYTGILEPFADVALAPPEVELVMRSDAGKRWLFALNYQPKPEDIELKRPVTALYDGVVASGVYTLAPFGTAVFGWDACADAHSGCPTDYYSNDHNKRQ